MFKFWILNYKNLQQPLYCMSYDILWFVFLISISYYVFLVLIILIFVYTIFILFQILRKQNTA